MPRPRVPQYFRFKIVPSRYFTAAQREELSDALGMLAVPFHCAGILDWSVTLGEKEKLLAVESEFFDLSARAGESHPIELWFETRDDATKMRAEVDRLYPQLKTTEIAREQKRDWMKLWRRHYRPIQIVQNGETLWIVPSWQKFPARVPHSLIVRIHPGQAFGTGTHPTTELCLRALFEFGPRAVQASGQREANFLDFGAGTGILGFAAWKWAKAHGLKASLAAVEIDPDARLILEKNRRLNRVPVQMRARLPKSGKFQIVFANVLSPVLLKQRKTLLARLAPGGLLVLSGVLREEGTDFLREFLRGADRRYSHLRSLDKEGWSAFAVIRASAISRKSTARAR